MSNIAIIDSDQLAGIGIVLTEMALQGYDQEQITEVMRPMNISAAEIHHLLEDVDPDWEKNEISYLVTVYLAWAEQADD